LDYSHITTVLGADKF